MHDMQQQNRRHFVAISLVVFQIVMHVYVQGSNAVRFQARKELRPFLLPIFTPGIKSSLLICADIPNFTQRGEYKVCKVCKVCRTLHLCSYVNFESQCTDCFFTKHSTT